MLASTRRDNGISVVPAENLSECESSDSFGRLRCLCNQHGRTALLYAAAGGHQEVYAWLADHGADPNATGWVSWSNDFFWKHFSIFSSFSLVCFCFDQFGITSLMLAAAGGHQEVCAWLADRGADPNATDGVSWSNDLYSRTFDPLVFLTYLLLL